jgi:hypothetical protein
LAPGGGGGGVGGSPTSESSSSQQPTNSQGDTLSNQAADQPGLIPAAYNGYYHDQVVKQLADGLRTDGLKVVTELSLCLVGGGPCSRADIAGQDPTGDFFVIEVKTGLRPSFTINQLAIYPHLRSGGTLFSPDAKITQIGLPIGTPLPPLPGLIYYKYNSSSKAKIAPIP